MRLMSRGSGCASAFAPGAILGVYNSEMAALFIVMPRRCSSSRKSMNLSLPASFWLMKPLCAMRPSDKVVFPWSTCARTQMFLMFSGRLCSPERRSTALSMASRAHSFLALVNRRYRRRTPESGAAPDRDANTHQSGDPRDSKFGPPSELCTRYPGTAR